MSWITEQLETTKIRLQMRHKGLSEHQLVLMPSNKESLSYAVLELKKAILECKIAIIKALLGESK